MKLNVNLEKGDWSIWEDGVEFLLRPYPISQITPGITEIELGLKMFKYCVVDWKGLVNEDTGNKILCNDKMKQYIYDHFPEISNFVATTITKRMNVEEKLVKN